MLNCFSTSTTDAIPLTLIPQKTFADWQTTQDASTKQWLTSTQFRTELGSVSLIPDLTGKLSRVVCCIADYDNVWNAGHLPNFLPEGKYILDIDKKYYSQLAIGWGLGAYQFTRYKKPTRNPAQLVLPEFCDVNYIENMVANIYSVRDWINTPTDDMGPSELAEAAMKVAKESGAKIKQIVGDDLLQENYAAIYTVGRASDDAPRLLDMHWGNAKHPKVTLVGKGVCFDSGGLDIKNSANMLLMKKDMAGAAHVLGLARMIMQAKLPINLRVLMPMVENVISGNAYRPGDIIKSRKGITIEIGNTDAEGRVILSDALTEAASDKPDLLIDISTLTGAARVALGTELPAMFCNNDVLADEIIKHSRKENDPLWRMPLFAPYREHLNSTIADINNNSNDPYAGAISAALFLKEFVPDELPWLHFDLMAWNLKAKPGRPAGGEAMALRALYSYLAMKYGSPNITA